MQNKKTILATAYAVNPYKGSEDGIGWNWICQIARSSKIIAITRENNAEHIEKYMSENPNSVYQNMQFLYYDLPYWARFWKKGGRGAMLYYYLWQITIPFFIKKQNLDFDIAHNLNFNNDWTPTFLWKLGKPLVWGPMGHHPKTPKNFLLDIYGFKSYLSERAKWMVKQYFWKVSPFLKKSAQKADHLIALNSSVGKVLNVDNKKITILPASASEQPDHFIKELAVNSTFEILSVGRFVPLKGFDVTISAFAQFFKYLKPEQQEKVQLTLVGRGEQKGFLQNLAKKLGVEKSVRFVEWMERKDLKKLYQSAQVFLFPSHEGAGMVVPEALSYGMPVVCFDNYGPGELMDETCGVKIPYGDYNKTIDSFAAHLFELHSNAQYLQKLSKGAFRYFENNFLWDKKGEIVQKIYHQILQNKRDKTRKLIPVNNKKQAL